MTYDEWKSTNPNSPWDTVKCEDEVAELEALGQRFWKLADRLGLSIKYEVDVHTCDETNVQFAVLYLATGYGHPDKSLSCEAEGWRDCKDFIRQLLVQRKGGAV